MWDSKGKSEFHKSGYFAQIEEFLQKYLICVHTIRTAKRERTTFVFIATNKVFKFTFQYGPAAETKSAVLLITWPSRVNCCRIDCAYTIKAFGLFLEGIFFTLPMATARRRVLLLPHFSIFAIEACLCPNIKMRPDQIY